MKRELKIAIIVAVAVAAGLAISALIPRPLRHPTLDDAIAGQIPLASGASAFARSTKEALDGLKGEDTDGRKRMYRDWMGGPRQILSSQGNDGGFWVFQWESSYDVSFTEGSDSVECCLKRTGAPAEEAGSLCVPLGFVGAPPRRATTAGEVRECLRRPGGYVELAILDGVDRGHDRTPTLADQVWGGTFLVGEMQLEGPASSERLVVRSPVLRLTYGFSGGTPILLDLKREPPR